MRESLSSGAGVPLPRPGRPAPREPTYDMSGDHSVDFTLPVYGTAAGVTYIALPPTAVDVVAAGPTHLIVVWPGFDPPRTASALAAAVPMTGVPAWRVFLGLPRQAPGG